MKVAIVGATGAVGIEIINLLEEIDAAISLTLLASKSSENKKARFKGEFIYVKELKGESDFKDIDIAFFCAGSNISREYVPLAVKAGARVIDNTSYFRMDEGVPLIIPEVNSSSIGRSPIIANPNCSTIQMVHVLAPLNSINLIKRVDVSTYQAVSGAGNKGMEYLIHETKHYLSFLEKRGSNAKFINDNVENKAEEIKAHDLVNVFPISNVAFNLFPEIDSFLPNGYTKEEMKMTNESNKIMSTTIDISATCVRVPVLRAHSLSLSIRFAQEVKLKAALEALNLPHIKIYEGNTYPTPRTIPNNERLKTHVGRIRRDLNNEKMLHLWVVADQLLVGAASNAVNIFKYILEEENARI